MITFSKLRNFQFYLKTLEKLACAQAESSAPIAEKLSENFSNVVGVDNGDNVGIEDDTDDAVTCPAIYTGNIGWLPLLILMVYIFFFNLVSLKPDPIKNPSMRWGDTQAEWSKALQIEIR